MRRVSKKHPEIYTDETVIDPRLSDAVTAAHRELGIPDHAREIDILLDRHTPEGLPVKDRRVYANTPVFVWIEETLLCLSDADMLIRIPLCDIISVRTIKKTIRLSMWHKSIPWYGDTYLQAHMDAYPNCYACHAGYTEVTVSHENTAYRILIPAYDAPLLKHVCGDSLPNESC